MSGSGSISEHFVVDDSVGRNLVIRIDFTRANYLRSFSLTSPSGVIYSELLYDGQTKVAMFKLPQAEVKIFNIKIKRKFELIENCILKGR